MVKLPGCSSVGAPSCSWPTKKAYFIINIKTQLNQKLPNLITPLLKPRSSSSSLPPIPEEIEGEEDQLELHENHFQMIFKNELKNDYQQELKDLEFIEHDFFSFVIPWLKLIPEGASVPLEEVRHRATQGFNYECFQ